MESGTQLGHYTISSLIGKGGMGEVYQAKDEKLGRQVAIKVLPEEFAQDTERVARFRREAQLLASLNHPNIAAIHGLEETDGKHFLVLELIEGPTLADRIKQGSIPAEESLKLALQIAEALEAAHEKGVIHRDLKPANIKVTPEGKVKVLDFGLAKAFEGSSADVSASNSPTLSMVATQQGIILGTAAYMSPEQARGHEVDARTDIWAFGVILYEMLTGKTLFDGGTVSDTLADVLRADVDWTALPARLPQTIHTLLRRCLEKERKNRLHAIADARLELADSEETAVQKDSRPGTRWQTVVALGSLLIAVSYVAITWRFEPSTGIATEWIGERLGGPTVAGFPVLSPDGTRLAFLVQDQGLTQVAVMLPGSGGSRQLTTDRTLGYALGSAWSEDSSRIYYGRVTSAGSNVYSIPVAGEAEERLVLEDAAEPRPLPDDSLLAIRMDSERNPQLIHFTPRTNEMETLPVLLVSSLFSKAIKVISGGREAVVVGRPEGTPVSENHIYVVDLSDGDMRRIAPELTLPLNDWTFALSVNEDEVYFVMQAGDLQKIVAAKLDGSEGVRTIAASLTRSPRAIDVAADGTLYLDQVTQASEILRVDPGAGDVERFSLSSGFEYILPLPDDRFLLAPLVGGPNRLVVVAPPGAPVPFLDTDEEVHAPLALVGVSSVAFLIGPIGDQQVGIATVDGRLQQRISIPDDGVVASLAATSDGTGLYYSVDGVVYQVPVTGGDSVLVHRGDEIAVDPPTGDLLILLRGSPPQLIRVSATGTSETSIPVSGAWQVWNGSGGPRNLMGHAVSPDGRVVLRTLPPASWLFPVGLLDARTGGEITPFLDPPETDMLSAGWDGEGRVVAIAHPYQSELWRFRPVQ